MQNDQKLTDERMRQADEAFLRRLSAADEKFLAHQEAVSATHKELQQILTTLNSEVNDVKSSIMQMGENARRHQVRLEVLEEAGLRNGPLLPPHVCQWAGGQFTSSGSRR